MAPKRQRAFGRKGQGNQKQKRKKLNLLTIRQQQDFRQFGELHPVNNSDSVRSYNKVTEESLNEEEEKKDIDVSSSDESDTDLPVMKELMAEIGMKEEEPESEQESDGEDEDNSRNNHRALSDEEEGSVEGAASDEGGNVEGASSDENGGSNDDDKLIDEEDDSDEENSLNSCDQNEEEVAGLSDEDGEDNGENLDTDKHPTVDNAEEEDEADLSEDGGEDEGETTLKESDPFTKHFEHERDMTDLFEGSNQTWNKQQVKIPHLGESMLIYKYESELPEPETSTDLTKLHVKKRICDQVTDTNAKLANVVLKKQEVLTLLQKRLFSVINTYQDILYPKQNHTNVEEIRLVYCMHALNHVLKTRSRVIAHNFKLKHNKKSAPDDEVEYRDQGLTRPKVLIVLPYRDRALKVVNMISSLLSSSDQSNLSNMKRFESEFSELEDSGLAGKDYKPDDFKKLFEGNTDDNFRIGLSISKKSLRLYSPFYESDIILASPLGLRMIIGLEGDKERDFDFLSSIEVLIVDQTDVYLMQNWDHILHMCKHMHMQPKESHGVDFSRVRMWSINGWSKHFRQTLMFSATLLPEILTIFNKQCHNYTGKILVQKNVSTGAIKSSISDAPQIFHRVGVNSSDSLSQRKAKFEYFKKKIIPYHTSAGMRQTLVFCNYFSFVLLRNFFRESEVDFLFMNEYDTEQKMRNNRIHFRKRHPHFMLYTERLHFHYRFRLRGIHHIVWFDLPQYPQFYSEIVNLMETSRQACTATTLFTKYEAQKLSEVVGSKQAAMMINSEKTVNMITVS